MSHFVTHFQMSDSTTDCENLSPYCGHVTLFWQLSIHHEMNVQYQRCSQAACQDWPVWAPCCAMSNAAHAPMPWGQPSYQGPLGVGKRGPWQLGCCAASHDDYA